MVESLYIYIRFNHTSHPRQLRNPRQETPQHWKNAKKLKGRRGFEAWKGEWKKKKETVGKMYSRPKIEMLSRGNRFQSANLKSHITLSWCESVRLFFFFISVPVFPPPHPQAPPPSEAHLQLPISSGTWGSRDSVIVGGVGMWTVPGTTQAPVPATGRSPRNVPIKPLRGYSSISKA